MVTAAGRPPVVWVRRAAVVLLAVDLIAFAVQGVNRAPRPYLSPATVTTTAAPPPAAPAPAFGSVAFSVTPRPGPAGPTHCALLASTPTQRDRGLMGRTTLAPFSGMVFTYHAASYDAYYMRDTPLPLSIAFFDGNGAFVSEATMAPCPNTAVSCPLYGASRPFRVALEVRAGTLASFGVGPGAVLHLGGGCSA